MNRDVILNLAGTQDSGGGRESTTVFQGAGQYYEKNGRRYLLYREQDAESGVQTSNTLKIGDGILELSRKGTVTARMVFEAGRTHPAEYITAYGALPLEVCTEELKCQWTETDASVIITYKLITAGTLLSRNRLIIKISEKG